MTENHAPPEFCCRCGATMSEQPRVPTGVPAGGQFAPTSRSEPSGSLPTDGSFYYPPQFDQPEDIIDFWATVPLPEEALETCEWYFNKVRPDLDRQECVEHAFNHGPIKRFYTDNPQPDPEADPLAYQQWEDRLYATKNAWEVAYAQRLADAPDTLAPSDVRPYLRAVAMCAAVEDWWDDAVATVHDHQIMTSAGPRRVGDIYLDSQLFAYRYMLSSKAGFRRMEEARAEAVAELEADELAKRIRKIVSKETQRQNQKIEHAFDDQAEHLQQVAEGLAGVVIGSSSRKIKLR